MTSVDEVTRKMFVVRVLSHDKDANAEMRGDERLSLRISMEGSTKSFGGFGVKAILPKKGTPLIYAAEYLTGNEMRSFLYDPGKKEMVRRNRLNDDDELTKYENQGQLELGKIMWMMEDRFSARLGSTDIMTANAQQLSVELVGYSNLRAFFGREPIVTFTPTGDDKPTEIYHGISGQLMYKGTNPSPGEMR